MENMIDGLRISLAYTFILVVFILLSCRKEEIAVPDTGRKIVINGLFTTDSLFTVNLSRSLYITDSNLAEENLLDNAHAVIYENNTYVDSMLSAPIQYINLGIDIYVPPNYRSGFKLPEAGHEYEIRVLSPGLPDASAIVRIPEPVKIESVDTTIVKLTGTFEDWESNIRMHCDIGFTDPENEKNYYMLYVYRIPAFYSYSNNLVFSCQDPIVEENLNHGTMMEGVAFSDKSINGQKHILSITLNGKDIGRPFYNDENTGSHRKTIYFRLYSVTGDYYKYIQTLNLFLRSYKNPLAEPAQVFSNVDGGYGIIGGASVSSDSIVFTY
jgi:hypothetical protein